MVTITAHDVSNPLQTNPQHKELIMRNVVFGLVIAISAMSFNAAHAKGTRAKLVVPPVTMQQAFDGLIERLQWMFSI